MVICYRVLSHMHSWEQLCEELMRVSRGMVLIDYPNKKSVNLLTNLFFGIKKQIEKSTRRYRLFSDDEVLAGFRARGWKKIFGYRQYFLPMALHRLFKCKPLSAGIEGLTRIFGLTLMFGSPVIAGFVCPELIELFMHPEATSMEYKERN